MRLVVFFSRGMSLGGWLKAGILDRELALYRALLPHLEHLAFVTYGGAEDAVLASQLPTVELLPNRWRLPSNLYSVLAPIIHRRQLRRATIFKTNQINGAWCAVIARRLFHKPLVVRCGFLWSDNVARLHPRNWRAAVARRLERLAFRAADGVIVAAEAHRTAIVDRYQIDAGRVRVIQNYVDTAAFRPMPEVTREPGRVVFVGRLDDGKNVQALIAAVESLPGVTLTIAGDGPRRDSLQAAAAGRGRVTFLGTQPHAALPLLLNQSAVFVLPSLYEGFPKVLIEAMACGVPVIGTRVPGIDDLLVHRENGYLCGTSAADLAAAIRDVLGDAALRNRISAGAIAYAHTHCSLASVAERELSLLRQLSRDW